MWDAIFDAGLPVMQQLGNCATEILAEIILKSGKMVMLIRYMHVHLKIC